MVPVQFFTLLTLCFGIVNREALSFSFQLKNVSATFFTTIGTHDIFDTMEEVT